MSINEQSRIKIMTYINNRYHNMPRNISNKSNDVIIMKCDNINNNGEKRDIRKHIIGSKYYTPTIVPYKPSIKYNCSSIVKKTISSTKLLLLYLSRKINRKSIIVSINVVLIIIILHLLIKLAIKLLYLIKSSQ